MIASHSTVRAGAEISEEDAVRLELRDDEMVAYPVDGFHDRLLLPKATEDAEKGELLTVRS